MMTQASAYNGGAPPCISFLQAGNTVGSLSVEERTVVVGCLLGDGTMRCKTNALLEINHSMEQSDYVDWKYRKLQRFVLTPPKSRKGNGNRVAYRFTTRSLPELTEWYRKFYRYGRKQIPEDLEIDPLGLAIWIMDDGSKSYRAMYLNTQQFSIEEQNFLMAKLESKFGIRVTLNRDKHYSRIRIAVESVARLYQIVQPYLLPQFKYKFPLMTP